MPIGRLKLDVVEAKDLRNKDWFSSSDPYVKITLGNSSQHFKTKVASGQNVRFEESFSFNIRDDNKTLHFEVMDKDTFTSDDTMGRAQLELASFLSGQPRDSWVPLNSKSGAPAGQLRVIITFYSEGAAQFPQAGAPAMGAGQYAQPGWQQPPYGGGFP
eukprot:CAMPEP_0113670390 /NCGR_PEP_ID=MMETSP0038_2-20120614/5113_1 /TAXON_ID=2898 /ORGANISM="Cryptomonas paramecium" /LENGTH=158 /DNA_ID=CAMNT_0000586407 /DNA_START=25 /DNA_END=498 /DNA_ORIENTATION=- /assembly_acc=CAM_ASM_000170